MEGPEIEIDRLILPIRVSICMHVCVSPVEYDVTANGEIMYRVKDTRMNDAAGT